MSETEWSRSRFWLCHFLHSRHDRAPVEWQTAVEADPPLASPLLRWLNARRIDPGPNGAWLVKQAMLDDAHDPAYIQSLRLMVKEQHYHVDLYDRLLSRLGANRRVRTGRGPIIRLSLVGRRLAEWRRRWLGTRFELSVRLLGDLSDLAVLALLEQSCSDLVLRGAGRNIGVDKRAHIIFGTERLTMLYADFNFVRRNLRRLRLRIMWSLVLAHVVWRHGRLIRLACPGRRRFLVEGMQRFSRLLEHMVPYHRDALLAALLTQRRHPYAKPQHLL